MNRQISLTIPEPMLRKAQQKAKEEGFRNVQEYCLQALRDKWFMDNLPRYERIAKQMERRPGKKMTVKEFLEWSRKI